MTIRRHWQGLHLGAGLVLAACGGTAGVRPPVVLVVTAEDRDWGKCQPAQPVYTESERAEIFWRFDPATQVARDYAAGGPKGTSGVLAIAYLTSPDGTQGLGVVRFEQERRQVLIYANVTGLSAGEHGFTIHEAGSCEEPANGDGGHFNPTHSRHGPIASQVRHAGDLGNVTVETGGRGSYAAVTESFQVSGDDSVVGRTVVVHARPDDGKTQPSGSSGPAVACGTIRLSNSSQVATGD